MWLFPNLLASKNIKQILIKAPEKGLQLHFLPLTSHLLWTFSLLTEHEKFLALPFPAQLFVIK